MDIRLGIYTHFKHPDQKYEVLGMGRHSETGDRMVIYKPLFAGSALEETGESYWVRPAAMFLESVDRDGYQGPRFTYHGPNA